MKKPGKSIIEGLESLKDQQLEAGFRGLIKSMVALAASDRIIDDREVWAIGKIFNNLTGGDLDPVEVRRASETFRDENLSIGEMLVDIEGEIDAEFKKTIIKACYLIGMADEILVQVELDDVRKVGGYLKLDPGTVDDLILEMEKMLQAEQPRN